MINRILEEAKITDQPALLARIVNVAGRFRKLDFSHFLELLLRFEDMCKKQAIGIDITNTFLDGIV
jgi:hypothetical protein